MSVKLALRSEASTRNEKNLPPALTDLGAARAAALLAAEGGTVRAPKPYGAPLTPHAPIALPKTDVARLLGFALEDSAVTRALQSLGFAVEDRTATFAVTPPAWRSDIAIPADIVEEIARVVGYDRLEAAMPPVSLQPLSSEVFDRDNALAGALAGLGYRECMTLAPAAAVDCRPRSRARLCDSASRRDQQPALRRSALLALRDDPRAPRDGIARPFAAVPHVRDRPRLRRMRSRSRWNATSRCCSR